MIMGLEVSSKLSSEEMGTGMIRAIVVEVRLGSLLRLPPFRGSEPGFLGLCLSFGGGGMFF